MLVKGKAGRLSQVVGAMGGLDVQALLQETASETISCWVVRKDQGGRIDTVRLDEAAAAYTMYMAGHSTYCRCVRGASQTDQGLRGGHGHGGSD